MQTISKVDVGFLNEVFDLLFLTAQDSTVLNQKTKVDWLLTLVEEFSLKLDLFFNSIYMQVTKEEKSKKQIIDKPALRTRVNRILLIFLIWEMALH